MTVLKSQIAKGAAWMVGLRLSLKSISIISTMILARLLTPLDFGLMALVSSIYAMIELFKAFSFDMALIQNQKTAREHYDTAWTLNIIFSVIASFFIVLCSKPLSHYYEDPRLTSALLIIALTVLIDGFNNVGTVEFRKQLNFSKEFKYQLLVKTGGFCITIPLAYYMHNYWALLLGMLSSTVISVLLSYILQSYRPKLSLKEKNELFSFCSWLYFNNFLQVINKNSQNFILGRISGSSKLGIFSLADEIANIATTEIIAPINRAAYPGYAKLADNILDLKSIYLKTMGFIAIIGLSCSTGVAVVAPLLVPLLLGEQWHDTIPIIQVIALASAADSLNTNASYIYITLKKQYIITRLLLLKTLLLLPLLLILSEKYSIQGAAFAILMTSTFMLPVNLFKISIVLNINWIEYLRCLYRPIIASTMMVCLLKALIIPTQDQQTFDMLLFLAASILIGAFTFCITLLLLWKLAGNAEDPEYMILKLLQQKFGKLNRA